MTLLTLLSLVPLEAVAAPVYPSRSNGFAGTLLIALLVVGMLAPLMWFITSKPKNRRRR